MEAIHAEEPNPLQHVAVGLLHKVGGRKNYSLAPCHHLFVRDPSTWWVLAKLTHLSSQHTECLDKWLAIKVSLLFIVDGRWLNRVYRISVLNVVDRYHPSSIPRIVCIPN